MNAEPETPSPFDSHDTTEPDREPDEQQPAQTPDEQTPCGGHFCLEFNGLKIDLWGKDLQECRLFAYDAILFVKKNFEKPDAGGDGIR